MKKLLLILFICSSHLLSAQVTEEWATQYDHENHGSFPIEMVVDYNGNVYVTGYTYDSVFTSKSDYLTLKYSSAGNILWAKTYGTNSELDVPTAICINELGNIYVSGGVALAADTENTLRYDTSGNIKFKFYQEEASLDNLCDKSGNVYILSEINSFQAIITKLNSNDSVIWSVVSDAITPKMILRDSLDNIFLLGQTAIDLDNSQYAVRKFSHDGVFLWEAVYNPSISDDQPRVMALDDSANVYVTGVVNWPSGGFGTVKFDSSGVFQWGRVFSLGGTLGSNSGKSIAVDKYGNSYVAGEINDGGISKYFALVGVVRELAR